MKSRYVNPALILVIASLLSTLAVAQQRRFSGGRGGNGPGGAGLAGIRMMPTSMPAVEKWEYGFLEITTLGGASAPTTRPNVRVIWRGPADEHAEASSLAELYGKLGGGGAPAPSLDDDLPIWNLLGEKGWEFAARDVRTVGLNAGGDERVTVRFKRPKR